MLILFNGYGFKENHCGKAYENKVKSVCWRDVRLGSLFVLNEVDTRVRNASHASKERAPRE